MIKGKKFHYEGQDRRSAVFVECAEDKEPEDLVVVHVEPARPGEAVRLGERLCHIKPLVDDSVIIHFEIEEIGTPAEHGRGPSKMSSNAYRSGWERVFGTNYIN